jgi:DNA-binding PadR family transcriptional regulator
VTVARTAEHELLLGEWACLGILCAKPTHGFAIAALLKPEGDVGRVWSLSRALTYRALEQLTARGYVHPVSEEPGIAGGNRTILAATRSGRAQLKKWLAQPVDHLRDVRSELLLKVLLADMNGIDTTAMLERQRDTFAPLAERLATQQHTTDPVAMWRIESSQAALRFVERLLASRSR